MLSTVLFLLLGLLVNVEGETKTCDELDLWTSMTKIKEIERQVKEDVETYHMIAEDVTTEARSYVKLFETTAIQSHSITQSRITLIKKILTSIHRDVDTLERNVNKSTEATRKSIDKLSESLDDTNVRSATLCTSVDDLVHNVKQLMLEANKIKAFSQCADSWISYKRSCYKFTVETKSFLEAAKSCEDLNGHLVYVESADENNFLKGYVQIMKEGLYWLGLTDSDSEKTWVFYGTNTAASFLDWYPGEPNNDGAGENCAHFWTESAGYRWNDYRCEEKIFYICEKEFN